MSTTAYLASLVKVDPALFARYSWSGRSIKYHRAQIRRVYGTRPPTEDDEERWALCLADGDVPDGDEPGPPGGRAGAALPQRDGGASEHGPGGARGRLGLPPVRRRLRRDDRRPDRGAGSHSSRPLPACPPNATTAARTNPATPACGRPPARRNASGAAPQPATRSQPCRRRIPSSGRRASARWSRRDVVGASVTRQPHSRCVSSPRSLKRPSSHAAATAPTSGASR
jgi:hypothetical protein